MTEDRRGEEWHAGMRVRVWNGYEQPGQWRNGTIVDRSWGRDRGEPIYRFTVEMEGVEGRWVFEPGQLHAPENE